MLLFAVGPQPKLFPPSSTLKLLIDVSAVARPSPRSTNCSATFIGLTSYD